MLSKPNITTDQTRIYYDAEFTGLHRNSTLISIGMYAELTGNHFYAEFTDYDESQISDWIRENVIANLILTDKGDEYVERIPDPNHVTGAIMCRGTRDFVAGRLLEWLKAQSDHNDGKKIWFCTDCYAYDWVLLNDLICADGDALKIPGFINYIPIDLSTMLYVEGFDPDISREEFAGEEWLKKISATPPFSTMGEHCKHNSLWDAVVAYLCFYNIVMKRMKDMYLGGIAT